jgi:hypothetical protein
MLRMLGLGEGQAVNQEGAIGWGEISAEGEAAVDVSSFCRFCGRFPPRVDNASCAFLARRRLDAVPASAFNLPGRRPEDGSERGIAEGVAGAL